MTVARTFILVLDSLGIGGADDAAAFGDGGADTLGHIADVCAAGGVTRDGREGPLVLPNLERLGLGRAAAASRGRALPGLDHEAAMVVAAYGYAAERSRGKDTPSGHWEIAGLPVSFDWGYFPKTEPCFPDDIITALIERCGLPGILGNRHASGTKIIEELGEEHLRSGKPICYTSADSVFQIAAHETRFGLERLYEVCAVAKELLVPLHIGRVIARPFVGKAVADFRRTAHRRDLTIPPHGPTLLDGVTAAGGTVVSVGKISDIFSGRGISRTLKAGSSDGLFDHLLREAETAAGNSLVFVNFVDFDSLYGHRRDVAGYAAALEALDRRLPEFEALLRPSDLAVITADHGCDPTWSGSDHTRENVPALFFGPGVASRDLGRRDSFADIGQTLAAHLGLDSLDHGTECRIR